MTIPTPRRSLIGFRLGVTVLASCIASLSVSRSTEADSPPERASGHANRKEWHEAAREASLSEAPLEEDAPSRPVETWATLFNVHSGEAIPLSSAEPSFDRFCETLADRTTASKTRLDPRLLELLRQIALRNPGARIELVSGYRSPKLNEMLRKKGHRVASRSRHTLGHAVDFRIIGLTPTKMKQELLKVGWSGGIGQYDKATDLFVHADVGPKREWFER